MIWNLLMLLALVYRMAEPGYHFDFPRDHFNHADFRTEWWYYTGNLHDAAGHRYGFELVFFRQGQPGAEDNRSAWALHDVYMAHLALTDAAGRRFRHLQRLNRQGPGIAGVSLERGRIWNGNWSADWHGDTQVLRAVAPEFRFELKAVSTTPPVLHGENGLSRKSDGPGRASYYVSLPRLVTTGQLTVAGKSFAVEGTAWMDHEWFTQQLSPDQSGWDWFSVQLDDSTELMLFELRRKDGGIDPHSSGSYIARDGTVTPLVQSDFSLKPAAWFHKYPIEWDIAVPKRKLALHCKAVLPDQEFSRYWEGAVDYTGTRKGVGYLEMTGYTKPVEFR